MNRFDQRATLINNLDAVPEVEMTFEHFGASDVFRVIRSARSRSAKIREVRSLIVNDCEVIEKIEIELRHAGEKRRKLEPVATVTPFYLTLARFRLNKSSDAMGSTKVVAHLLAR